jgi:L-ascorbate metabolism protein UlaG (beta-lactamase superfamily)
MEYQHLKIKWLGQAGLKIKNQKIVYFDPYQIKETEEADLVLVTHSHFDHFSLADIKKIISPSTVLVAPFEAGGQVNCQFQRISAGEEREVKGIKVKAIPAYNLNKSFHPPRGEGVGYVVEIEGIRIYQAGDTDLIPEMKELTGLDLVFLPVGGTYTMDAEEAAEAANQIKAQLSIPIHYGSVVGSEKDARRFKELVLGKVEILPLP